MLRILATEGQGFFSLDHFSFSYAQPELVLVVGNNLDKGGSSGAGKSSVIALPLYALCETSDRDIVKDAVTNAVTGSGLEQVTHIACNSKHYKVVHVRRPGTLSLRIFDTTDSVDLDITEGTRVEAAWAQLRRITGLSAKLFTGLAYMGQSSAHEFVFGTDADRKRFLSGVLGLELWDACYAQANQEKIDIEDLEQVQAAQRDQLTSRIATLEEQLKSGTQTPLSELRTAKAAATTDKIRVTEELPKLRAKAKSLCNNLPKLYKKRQEVAGSLLQIASGKLKLAKLRGNDKLPPVDPSLLDKTRALLKAKRSSLARLEGAATATTAAIADLDQLGNRCFSCQRPITTSEKLAIRAQLVSKLPDPALIQKLHDSTRKLEEQAQWLSKVIELQAEVAQMEAGCLQEEAKALDQAIARTTEESQQASALVAIAEREYDRLTVELASLDKQLEAATEIERKLNAAIKELAIVTTEIARLRNEKEVLRVVERVFGQHGVKAYKLDTAVAFLNECIKPYAERLSGNQLKIEYRTYTEGKKGDRDSLVLLVTDPYKGPLPIKGWSGGEKQKVTLASLLGLSDMASRMTNRSVNVLMLDEPFANLDTVDIERALDVLKTLERQGRTIWVSTNSSDVASESASFDRVITCVRKQGVTTISPSA